MKRKIYQFSIIVASVFVINGLSRNLVELWQQRQRVERIKQELAGLEQKEVELTGQLRYYESDEYVEKIAREKLMLGREGETVLLFPTGTIDGSVGSQFSMTGTVQEAKEEQNWKKWLLVFGLSEEDSSYRKDAVRGGP